MSSSCRRTRIAVLPLLVTGILGVPVSASSQPTAPTSAEPSPAEHPVVEATPADVAFARGKSLVDGGDTAGACEAFAESYRLEPALGTLLNLAWCHEQTHKLALALAEYVRARAQAEEAGQSKRVRFASLRIEALLKSVPRILVELAPADQQAVVSLDGAPVDRATLREPIPLDPGEHQLTVRAENRRPFQRQVRLGPQGGVVRILVPKLDALSATARPARETSAVATQSRTVGIVVGGAGVLAVGAGTYFGVRTFSLKRDSDGHCQGSYCDDTGLELSRDAERAAALSTISFVAGGAAIAVGTWFMLRSPGGARPHLRAQAGACPAGGYMGLVGDF